MLDKLIKKVIEDAEKKAIDIIRDAEKDVEERYSAEKEVIEKEYELRIQAEKERIDREMERKVSAFVMEKEKEILALKNTFIDEVLKLVEEKFNEHLNKNMVDIITSFCKGIKGKDYKIKVPPDKNFNMDGVVIEKDSSLKNAFVVSSSNWEIVFNWESVRRSMEDVLKEEAGRFLQDNG